MVEKKSQQADLVERVNYVMAELRSIEQTLRRMKDLGCAEPKAIDYALLASISDINAGLVTYRQWTDWLYQRLERLAVEETQ